MKNAMMILCLALSACSAEPVVHNDCTLIVNGDDTATVRCDDGSDFLLENDCPAQWAKVFEASYDTSNEVIWEDRWFEIDVSMTIPYSELKQFVRDGYDFKITAQDSAAGGAGTSSYECSYVVVSEPAEADYKRFHCLTALMAATGFQTDSFSHGMRVVFRDDGRIYHQPLENQSDSATPDTFSIFVRE